MDWTIILNQLVEVCLVPILAFLTTALINWVKAKIEETRTLTKNEITIKYLNLLEDTIVDCIEATNQTYVDALKGQNAFDAEAQRIALEKTKNAVLDILSEDAIVYLTNFVGDLNYFIENKIEAKIAQSKK